MGGQTTEEKSHVFIEKVRAKGNQWPKPKMGYVSWFPIIYFVLEFQIILLTINDSHVMFVIHRT